MVSLTQDVLDHGEVHATWADSEGEVIVIEDGSTEHMFTMDRLVRWEKPMNVFESDV